MDTKGKGPLLLLLASTLVLCQNEASRSTCVPGDKCQEILQNLYHRAKSLSRNMYFYAADLFLRVASVHFHHTGYISGAKKSCHNDDIYIPAGLEEARKMQEKNLFHAVMHLLDSWNDPLQELVPEAHRLLKLYNPRSPIEEGISLTNQQLKKVIIQIAIQLDFEVTEEEEISWWSDLESLKSSDEKTRLFTVYNNLRCFVIDVNKIIFLVSILKCQADNKGNCYAVFSPSVSELFSHDSSWNDYVDA